MSGRSDDPRMPTFPVVVIALALLLTRAPAEPAPHAALVVREVPVLMYHVIADPPAGAAWPHLFVSPREFAAQVSWLAERGFTAVTLSEVWRNWHDREPLPARPIVFTFDDGYASVARTALPVLVARKWPAVLNLKVRNLGEGGMTDGQVRRLLVAGWELGAHTISHPDLTTVDAAGLEREVTGSRAAIERRFGVAVEFFCYPSGRYDERVIAAVKRAGYRGATTTDFGLATAGDPFRLKRVRVSRGDGVSIFASALPARTGA